MISRSLSCAQLQAQPRPARPWLIPAKCVETVAFRSTDFVFLLQLTELILMDKLLENPDSKGAAKEFPQESTDFGSREKTHNQMFILYLHRKWYRLTM